MNKAQKTILTFLAIALSIIAALYAVYSSSPNSDFSTNDTILYYGLTCPHCKIIEDYLKNNSLDSKISIIQKEIWANSTNQEEFAKVIKKCSIPRSQAGVPLLYSDGKCYLGDTIIVSFLQDKLKSLEETA